MAEIAMFCGIFIIGFGALFLVSTLLGSAPSSTMRVKQQIRKMVGDAGGEYLMTDVKTTTRQQTTTFHVTYINSDSIQQTRSAVLNGISGKNQIAELYWDKPIGISASSKEQIISEMAAEIETLKRQLNERGGDSAEN